MLVDNSPVAGLESVDYSKLSNNKSMATETIQNISDKNNISFGWEYKSIDQSFNKEGNYALFVSLTPTIALLSLFVTVLFTGFAFPHHFSTSLKEKVCGILPNSLTEKIRINERVRGTLHNLRSGKMQSILVFVAVFLLILLFYYCSETIYYINPTGEETKDLWKLMSDGAFGRKSLFYLLITLQSLVSSITFYIWTRPLIPKEHSCRSDLRLHLDNWRTYGTWVGTLFGAVGISAGLAFVTDAAGFGPIFIRYVIYFFGSAMVINLIFIIYKISELEKEIVNSNQEN
jgi:hypothetical protein